MDDTWGRPTGGRAFVLGVVGARGGAGSSTFAAALAERCAPRSATALVDLDRAGAGIDVLLGVERSSGARWPDVGAARGSRGDDVLALLPTWRRCAVLSADRTASAPPQPEVVADVVAALAEVVGVLVLDIDRAAVVAREAVVAACDALVVVTPLDLRSAAGALAMRPVLAEAGAGLVVRTLAPGGLGRAELADAVGLPVVATLRHVRGLAAATERGGIVPGRALRRAADETWRTLTHPERGGTVR